ncbi:hypothetical protein JCM19376_40780 [Fusibacter bizertensis]
MIHFSGNNKSQNHFSEENLQSLIIKYLDDFSSSNKELLDSVELVEYTTYGSIEQVSGDEIRIPIKIIEHYNKNKANYPIEFEIVFVLADFFYNDDLKVSGDENIIDGIKGTYFVIEKKNKAISIIVSESWF